MIENATPQERPARGDTRQRLITAARALFAERGFQSATIRDIAARAQTNLASINYHFRSKDDLYRAVLQETLVHAADEDIAVPAPPQSRDERLAAFIRFMMHGAIEGDEHERGRLLAWELLRPTGLIDKAKDVEILPFVTHALEVAKAFAPRADADRLADIALWLIGQCLLFRRTGRNDAKSCDMLAALAKGGLLSLDDTPGTR